MSEIAEKNGTAGHGWRDRDWDKLLSCVEEQTVIPIIGKDLLEIRPKEATEPVQLYRYIAEQLIGEFSIDRNNLSAASTLSDVVYCCLQNGIDHYDIRHSIICILNNAECPPPTALTHLAEITDFNLFVTTTFDPFMEQTLKGVRYDGTPSMVEVRSYDPKEPLRNEDLNYNGKRPNPCILFHLMGRLCRSSDNVVISDEDMLEFVCALHSENRIPKKLFDELQNKHLLVLGCSFSDWLARFFLRAAKRRRLSESRTAVEFVVDDSTVKDRDLVLFLQHFSRSTRIYRSGNAIAFTQELRDRWLRRNPKPSRSSHAVGQLPRQDPPEEMPPGAIFVSYASEDLAAVQVLKAHLDAYGLPVWFDKDQLQSGELYEKKIYRYIQNCSLFVPVVSARTERRLEGFFRREWRYAARRKFDMDDSVAFIMPVVLDDTRQDTARVPDCFLDVQWELCPAGTVKQEFAQRLRLLINLDTSGRASQRTYSVT